MRRRPAVGLAWWVPRVRRAFGWLSLTILLAASCRQGPSADAVVLALGDQVVRRSEFERHVAGLENRGGSTLDPEVRRALLEPFLEERLLVLEARARRLVAVGAPAEQEQAAVQRLLQEEAFSTVEVTDEEVEAHFREHASDLKVEEAVTLRQILVPTLNEARDVRRRLVKDPKSFEVLARTMSQAPEASAGGLMGVFSKGQLPQELEEAAFATAPGGTSEVIQTSLGYHVLRVEAREPAREPSLAESRARIRAELSREKRDQAVRQFVRELMSRAKVNHEAANPRPRNDRPGRPRRRRRRGDRGAGDRQGQR